MAKKPTLTAERARELLDYDPETGVFRWRVDRSNRAIGASAGCVDPVGYRRMTIDSRKFLGHRVAWLIHYGEWPNGMIDHIDGDRTNNRIANLRPVDRSRNNLNRLIPSGSKVSGLPLGVYNPAPGGRRHRALLKIDGRQRIIGNFDTVEEAHLAYLAAKSNDWPDWDAGRS